MNRQIQRRGVPAPEDPVNVQVTIRGTKPILWNHLRPHEGLGKQSQNLSINDPSEWRYKVLMTRRRQLYLLPRQVFSCLREATQYFDSEQESLQRNLSATLEIAERYILLDRYVPFDPIKSPEDIDVKVYVLMSVVKAQPNEDTHFSG